MTAPLRPFAVTGCLAFHYTQFSQILPLVKAENLRRKSVKITSLAPLRLVAVHTILLISHELFFIIEPCRTVEFLPILIILPISGGRSQSFLFRKLAASETCSARQVPALSKLSDSCPAKPNSSNTSSFSHFGRPLSKFSTSETGGFRNVFGKAGPCA